MDTALNKSARMILAGVAIAALSVNVYARGDGDCGYEGYGPMMGADREHMGERMEKWHEKRQAALHDKLKLSAQQETAWKKYTAQQPVAGMMERPDPAEMAKLNAPQRLEKGLERMKALEAKLAEHLAALKEFYAVLTPEQQKIFDQQMQQPGERGRRSK